MAKNPHSFGFVTVAAAAPALRLGDPVANTQLIIQALEKAAAEGSEIVVLPGTRPNGLQLWRFIWPTYPA
jgi:predicted amidohydrolase